MKGDLHAVLGLDKEMKGKKNGKGMRRSKKRNTGGSCDCVLQKTEGAMAGGRGRRGVNLFEGVRRSDL